MKKPLLQPQEIKVKLFPFITSYKNIFCSSRNVEFFDGNPFSAIFCEEKLSLKERPRNVWSFNSDEKAHCKNEENVISGKSWFSY